MNNVFAKSIRAYETDHPEFETTRLNLKARQRSRDIRMSLTFILFAVVMGSIFVGMPLFYWIADWPADKPITGWVSYIFMAILVIFLGLMFSCVGGSGALNCEKRKLVSELIEGYPKLKKAIWGQFKDKVKEVEFDKIDNLVDTLNRLNRASTRFTEDLLNEILDDFPEEKN